MKRPDGFDRPRQPASKPAGRPATGTPATSRPTAPARPAGRTAAAPPASAPARPGRTPRPDRAPAADRPEALASRRAREAQRELRRATAARRREERGEVKRFTRRARRRRRALLGTAAVAVVFVIGIAVAVFSPLLALRTVQVTGTERIDAAEVRQALADQIGTPLALVDTARLRSELSRIALIRSFSTEVAPPHTLVIRIVEREPVGVLQTSSGFDLVDPAGVVIETTPTRPANLPLIQLGAGQSTDSAAFRSMGEVLDALPASLRGRVDGIAASTRSDVTLTLSGSSQSVIWGSADSSATKAVLLDDLVRLDGDKGPGQYDVSAEGTGVFHAG